MEGNQCAVLSKLARSNRERDAPNFHTIQFVAGREGGRPLENGRMHFDSYGATT